MTAINDGILKEMVNFTRYSTAVPAGLFSVMKWFSRKPNTSVHKEVQNCVRPENENDSILPGGHFHYYTFLDIIISFVAVLDELQKNIRAICDLWFLQYLKMTLSGWEASYSIKFLGRMTHLWNFSPKFVDSLRIILIKLLEFIII